jgi:hypothetical protein
MSMPPAALFPPFAFWLPLAALLLLAQAGILRLVLRPARGTRMRSLFGVLLADALLVMALRFCVARMGSLDYSERFLIWRQWFLVMGIVLVGLPLPLWVLVLRLAGANERPAEAVPPLINPLFKTALAMWLTAGLLVLVVGGDFTFLPKPARVTAVEVPVIGLPRELDGVHIAVLTDLHVGSLVTPDTIRTRLRALKKVKADLLVILGDVTYLDSSYQPVAARLLREYVIPQRTFAVGGNLDAGAGTDTLEEELTKVGIAYLDNELACVSLKGASLAIAGLSDAWTGSADLDDALSGVPEGATTILLSHSPDTISDAAARGVDLVLAGHLHGGQIVIPFAGPAVGMSRFGTRFTSGLWRVGSTHLVVSRGLGEEGIPLRLFCPPEIVLVTLRAGGK